jgi:DNA polymerase-1
MIMQVHDELVFEIPTYQLASAQKIIEGYMMQAADLAVPLEVGTGTGLNWEVAH